MLLVNLRMDSTSVKESMNIKWVSETGIVENVTAIVKDFKETRGFLVSLYSCQHNSVTVKIISICSAHFLAEFCRRVEVQQ